MSLLIQVTTKFAKSSELSCSFMPLDLFVPKEA